MYVIRDPAKNVCIDLPKEMHKNMNDDGFEAMVRRNLNAFSPTCDGLIDVYRRSRRIPVLV